MIALDNETKSTTSHEALLDAPQHVLSTLERDGSRRWLRPSLAKGKWWQRRRITAYGLIAFFVTLPHLRINGLPPLLVDIPGRRLVVAGHIFLPTDTLLLALAMVSVFLVIMLTTTLFGRLWCGWGCPQTVYMEYVFRPIDRLFEGTTGRGGQPRGERPVWKSFARVLVYVVLSMGLAHTFLSYFVGTDRLARWITSSPADHPAAFAVMAVTTGAMLFDFLYFREQMCTIACPYGRFQSVMLDRHSLVVAYDQGRGEPRGKVSQKDSQSLGDCVDCHRCVAVCPTGIDIRQGLQMECINCTQCIDACDDIMVKVGRPTGLIRYGSQASMDSPRDGVIADGKTDRLLKLRPRTVIYPLLLLTVVGAFVAVLSTKFSFEAHLLRAAGNPYSRDASGEIRNRYRLRLTNRTDQVQSLQLAGVGDVVVESEDDGAVQLQPSESRLVPVSVVAPAGSFVDGRAVAEILIRDDAGHQRTVEATLLGPRR